MIIVSKRGHGKVKLTDEQMSHIMSGLAAAYAKWDQIKDKEVSTTKNDLLLVSSHLLDSYAGVARK